MKNSRVDLPDDHIGAAVSAKHVNRSPPQVSSVKVVDLQDVFKHLRKIAPKLGLKAGPLKTLEALAFSHRPPRLAVGEPFIVFRSNRSLSERTGLPEQTLRDHFKVLIRLTLMSRKDSPNGQRRPPHSSDCNGYGFDLSLLIYRADEFAELACDVDKEKSERGPAKRALADCRYALTKIIDDAVALNPSEEWQDLKLRFKASYAKRMRDPTSFQLMEKLRETERLREEANSLWITSGVALESGANGNEIRRHIQSTSLDPLFKEEVPCDEILGNPVSSSEPATNSHKGMTWDQIRRAFPSLENYGPRGVISSSNDFDVAVKTVAGMFQITRESYDWACKIMGRFNVAITISYMLQLGEQIASPVRYFHGLTKQFGVGDYSPTRTASKFLGSVA